MAQQDNTLDLMKQWFEVNQQLWTSWLNSGRHLGKGPSGIDEAYHEQVKGLRHLIDETMRLERDWMKTTREQAAQTQALEPGMRFFTDMAEQALETRSRLWKTLFDTAEAVDLSAPANAFAGVQGPQEFMSAMRDLAERMLGNQQTTAKKTAEAAQGAAESAAQPAKPGAGSQSKQAKAG